MRDPLEVTRNINIKSRLRGIPTLRVQLRGPRKNLVILSGGGTLTSIRVFEGPTITEETQIPLFIWRIISPFFIEYTYNNYQKLRVLKIKKI